MPAQAATFVCPGCGLGFIQKPRQRTKRYCSQRCWRDQCAIKVLRNCQNCGATYKPKHKNRQLFYCSQACGRKNPCSPRVREVFDAYHAKRRAKSLLNPKRRYRGARVSDEEMYRRLSGECSECGVAFRRSTVWQKACADCGVARERRLTRARNRAQGNGGSHVRRAKKFGCEYETVNVVEVFRRDGYRCQRCGAATPSHLRGSRAETAPNLDHIIPLVLGGSHTYANTQCLCLKCNLRKGARMAA